jgi:hypothetical protein
LYSLCRCVDWFDGQKLKIRLDIQLNSALRFTLNSCITILGLRQCMKKGWCFEVQNDQEKLLYLREQHLVWALSEKLINWHRNTAHHKWKQLCCA